MHTFAGYVRGTALRKRNDPLVAVTKWAVFDLQRGSKVPGSVPWLVLNQDPVPGGILEYRCRHQFPFLKPPLFCVLLAVALLLVVVVGVVVALDVSAPPVVLAAA